MSVICILRTYERIKKSIENYQTAAADKSTDGAAAPLVVCILLILQW